MTTTDRDLEALSALMDGELQDLELRRTLGRVSEDASLRARWQRHQQVSEALQSKRVSAPSIDVSSSVMESLEGKPSLSRNPMWSVAIAASVTIAVVMGGQQLLTPSAGVSSSPLISDIGGGVVPVMGAQPVQASLGAKSIPVTSRPSQDSTVVPEDVSAVYERLARDRYRRLNPRHAQAAALSHPAPYISYVRAPTEPLGSDSAQD
jgi:sigma-E factor negative regulatory protein RseA